MALLDPGPGGQQQQEQDVAGKPDVTTASMESNGSHEVVLVLTLRNSGRLVASMYRGRIRKDKAHPRQATRVLLMSGGWIAARATPEIRSDERCMKSCRRSS